MKISQWDIFKLNLKTIIRWIFYMIVVSCAVLLFIPFFFLSDESLLSIIMLTVAVYLLLVAFLLAIIVIPLFLYRQISFTRCIKKGPHPMKVGDLLAKRRWESVVHINEQMLKDVLVNYLRKDARVNKMKVLDGGRGIKVNLHSPNDILLANLWRDVIMMVRWKKIDDGVRLVIRTYHTSKLDIQDFGLGYQLMEDLKEQIEEEGIVITPISDKMKPDYLEVR